ncbi:MAG TPA: ATP-binding protein [Bdellovibrionota bacterium]|nr:ATP-binding protein [Bdellovibrionota bacterium]
MAQSGSFEPLDTRERLKRKREAFAIGFLGFLFIILTIAEFRLTKVSSALPFVNSIFFFGLLNVNLIILIALVWLVFRNIGKVFIERRRKVLGSRLKTKLVIAFLAFSIIPTLVLFVISAMYINSSFDKWFSIKIQNTLQASLEITGTYYRNTEQTAMHFAEHLSNGLGRRLSIEPGAKSRVKNSVPGWVEGYLRGQRELLALDAVEYYIDPLEDRVLAQRSAGGDFRHVYPRLSLDLLEKAFSGERVPAVQHIGTGDLIRCIFPVRQGATPSGAVLGVIVVNAYIPVSLVNKVDEIASVFDDYKDTNPLKYPMKTTYFVILVMITLVIIFVAIWIGLYMARELTVPVERLVHGAQAVGAGNLDVLVAAAGHDEISVLVESFNRMTRDLRDNRERLTQASADLERRRLQLEAVLANIGAGVIAIDSAGRITTFNPAAAKLLQIEAQDALSRSYLDVLQGESASLAEAIARAFTASREGVAYLPDVTQWHFKKGEAAKVLSAIATPLRESEAHWGVVAVIDDMTDLIKGQREMAWREVARRIAHEIKNPLTPIKLSAQRLQRRLAHVRGTDGALLQECTETIVKHTDELKEMVNEFSHFARFPEASPARHDLNVALGEVIALYQQAHPQIAFKVELESKLPIFEFDREQIKRVAINLLDNAVAALISLTDLKNRQIRIATHYNEQLKMAVIEVSDNGPGMSDEVKTRVFEPYFSTKAEGTGLGLAIAKRIVNDHDGFIRVHSAPGQGTGFLIELPTSLRTQPKRG